jgi:hypothetical protein
MKCSDCRKYKTRECEANPTGADWDSAESYSCFELKGDTSSDIPATNNQTQIDRQKIYEEEKARAEAQERIRKEQAAESGKKIGKGCLIIAAIVVVLVIAIAIPIATCDTESSQVDLNASVSYNDGQFTITNNDNFDWYDVKFTLNSDYELRHPVIAARTTYTVGSMQFAKSDGTMFNPFTMKPLTMSIYCDTPDGKYGWWFGEW